MSPSKDTGICWYDGTCDGEAAVVADAEDEEVGTSSGRNRVGTAWVDWRSDRCNSRTPAIPARIVPEDTGSQCASGRASSARLQRNYPSTRWSCCRSHWCWQWRCRRWRWSRRFPSCPRSAKAPRCSCGQSAASRSSSASCPLGKSARPSSGVPGRRSGCASGDARDRSPLSAGFSLSSAPVRRKKGISRFNYILALL